MNGYSFFAPTVTTKKGTGTFVVVWAGTAAGLVVLSQSVTSRRGNGFLLLQIEILSLGGFECLDL